MSYCTRCLRPDCGGDCAGTPAPTSPVYAVATDTRANLHPYECGQSCIHCRREKTADHDPDNCLACYADTEEGQRAMTDTTDEPKREWQRAMESAYQHIVHNNLEQAKADLHPFVGLWPSRSPYDQIRASVTRMPLLSDSEHGEAWYQFRRLEATGDPYALDRVIESFCRRRVLAAQNEWTEASLTASRPSKT